MANDRLLHFVETTTFRKRLDKLADLNTLFAIQADLLENPKSGDVIQGCGGARKGRVGDQRGSKGKSGGFRYIYLYLEAAETITFLCFIQRMKNRICQAKKREYLQR